LRIFSLSSKCLFGPILYFYFLFLEPWKPPPQSPERPRRHRQSREKPPCLAKEKVHQNGTPSQGLSPTWSGKIK
jgi:hypothetical protein